MVLAGCNSSKPVKAAEPAAKEEKALKAAPEFDLKDADGKTVRLSDYKGKVVVLDFWATWCRQMQDRVPLVHMSSKADYKGLRIRGGGRSDWMTRDGRW